MEMAARWHDHNAPARWECYSCSGTWPAAFPPRVAPGRTQLPAERSQIISNGDGRPVFISTIHTQQGTTVWAPQVCAAPCQPGLSLLCMADPPMAQSVLGPPLMLPKIVLPHRVKWLIRAVYFSAWHILCILGPEWRGSVESGRAAPFSPRHEQQMQHKDFVPQRAWLNLCFLKDDKCITSTPACTRSLCLMRDPCLSAERTGPAL